MHEGADVRAITSLQDWHNQLSRFRQEAMEAISMINMEVRRAYDWVDDMGRQWKHEIREAEEEVVQRKAELAQRQIPNFDGRIPDTTVQERNLARAKARLEYAHDQVDICRKWSTKLPKMVGEEYEAVARKMSTMLEAEIPAALSHLTEQLIALERYMSTQVTSSGG